MSNTTVTDITAQLAAKMARIAELQAQMSEVNAEVESLRGSLQEVMGAGSYKTLEENGIQATIRTKNYPHVVDTGALRAHLVSLGKEPDYIVSRFDQVKARNDAVKNGWPGVEVEVRDELVVKVVAS